jgi:hypothetical protein
MRIGDFPESSSTGRFDRQDISGGESDLSTPTKILLEFPTLAQQEIATEFA